MRINPQSAAAAISMVVLMGLPAHGISQNQDARDKVVVDQNGTVHVPPETVPVSEFLSPESRAYVAEHLIQMQNPDLVKQDNGVPRFMKPFIERDQALFSVNQADEHMG